jgi:hypothetical protein
VTGGEDEGVIGGSFDCTFDRPRGVRGAGQERDGFAVGVVPPVGEFADDPNGRLAWHIRRYAVGCKRIADRCRSFLDDAVRRHVLDDLRLVVGLPQALADGIELPDRTSNR